MSAIRGSLVIGVNKYHSSIGQLRFCVADAKEVARALDSRREGFASTESTILIDGAELPPTYTNIVNQVAALCKNASPEDTILIFFAGHGAIGADGGLYLLPLDASALTLEQTSVPWRWIEESLRLSRAGKKILILDACHSGVGRGAEVQVDARAETIIATLSESTGDFVSITSCDSGQRSYELEELGQGIFSHYLATGISGAADKLQRGRIDVGSLYEYVCERTLQHAKQFQLAQQPRLIARTGTLPEAIYIAAAPIGRPVDQVLVLTEDPVVGASLQAAIDRSTLARGGSWQHDVNFVRESIQRRLEYDAAYIDITSNWAMKREFIISVRKRYPIVPFVLVGYRAEFLESLKRSERSRFRGYFFLDLSTPLGSIQLAVDDTLSQIVWDIQSRYGEKTQA